MYPYLLVTLLVGLSGASFAATSDVTGFCGWRTDGVYGNPADCSGFIECSNGVTSLFPCPANTVFNADISVCDHPDNVPSCHPGPTPSHQPPPAGTTTTEGHILHDFCRDKTNGIHGDPDDCDHFIECAYGHTYIMKCAPGTVFNVAIKVCDNPHNVICHSGSATQAPVSHPATPTGRTATTDGASDVHAFCQWKADGVYGNPADCSGFIECSNGVTSLFPCPANTVFNANSSVCDHPDNVPSCHSGPTPSHQPPVGDTTTTGPSMAALCQGKPDGNYPHPSDCRHFIECSNGLTNVMRCADGTVFNPFTADCDNPSNAPSCHTDVTGFCRDQANGVYPHPADCRRFLECSNGYTSIMACPTGTVFNPAVGRCDSPANVPGCHRRF